MDIAAAAEALQKFSGTNLTDALSRIERSLGMARDYIYRMGRLARSEIAATRFTIDEDMRDLWRSDFLLAASKVAAARRALGDELAGPVQRILDDPLVIPAFKDALSDGGSQPAGT
jgi:hypothetical protein